MVDQHTRPHTTANQALYATFETAATLAGAGVTRCDLASAIETARELVQSGPGDAVRVTEDLLTCLPDLSPVTSSESLDPDTVVSRGLLGVCATGSVAVAEAQRSDRLISLLAARHILLLPAERLVPGLSDAVPFMTRWVAGARRYVTFVTGPSRTADIEKVLTVGAHGPARLDIVVVDGWAPLDD